MSFSFSFMLKMTGSKRETQITRCIKQSVLFCLCLFVFFSMSEKPYLFMFFSFTLFPCSFPFSALTKGTNQNFPTWFSPKQSFPSNRPFIFPIWVTHAHRYVIIAVFFSTEDHHSIKATLAKDDWLRCLLWVPSITK